MAAAVPAALPMQQTVGIILYEAAVPVVTEEAVSAVVYVGNAAVDKEKSLEIINRTCRFTGVSPSLLRTELKKCEEVGAPEELLQIGEIVKDYIIMLVSKNPKKKNEEHWLVSVMKKYAEQMFCEGILLKEIAVTYQKNEKYIGRLLKRRRESRLMNTVCK